MREALRIGHIQPVSDGETVRTQAGACAGGPQGETPRPVRTRMGSIRFARRSLCPQRGSSRCRSSLVGSSSMKCAGMSGLHSTVTGLADRRKRANLLRRALCGLPGRLVGPLRQWTRLGVGPIACGSMDVDPFPKLGAPRTPWWCRPLARRDHPFLEDLMMGRVWLTIRPHLCAASGWPIPYRPPSALWPSCMSERIPIHRVADRYQ
jgi:hypothetical protein